MSTTPATTPHQSQSPAIAINPTPLPTATHTRPHSHAANAIALTLRTISLVAGAILATGGAGVRQTRLSWARALFNYNPRVSRSLSISCFAAVAACLTVPAVALGPCPAPTITSQPVPTIACRMGSASFGVSATSDTALTYQWQRQVTAGVFENLSDSTIALGNGTMTLYGTQTARLRLATNVLVGSPSTTFRCIVTNACGSEISTNATMSLISTCCQADLDNDGSFANGNARDNAVTIDDLLCFLEGFEIGHPTLDMDNGTYTGIRDGVVDVSDLLFFLARFDDGC